MIEREPDFVRAEYRQPVTSAGTQEKVPVGQRVKCRSEYRPTSSTADFTVSNTITECVVLKDETTKRRISLLI